MSILNTTAHLELFIFGVNVLEGFEVGALTISKGSRCGIFNVVSYSHNGSLTTCQAALEKEDKESFPDCLFDITEADLVTAKYGVSISPANCEIEACLQFGEGEMFNLEVSFTEATES